MVFTSIQLRGFLRFHDSSLVKFASGVTGVVGPEGCGKYDLIMSLKWVLSENPVLEMPKPLPYESKWQSPSVTLFARDDAGTDYELSRRLTYEGRLQNSVNGHEMRDNEFEQYLCVFRSALEVPRDASAVALACKSSDKGKFFIIEELDKNLSVEQVDAFAESLVNLAEKNQLLVVTYSKKVMAITDTMYGVTMEKYGKARLIGMRLTNN
ncbi:MAG: hypothetical protein AB8F34_13205 [Akkermansiaceae bacterium]